jgi:pimeloyl-ACP methyl ester carboxylesterase
VPAFQSGSTAIAYLDEGAGDPIVLVHGFASNKEVNWVQPGWVYTLTQAGFRVIALDNRGHGASAKFYDPECYRVGVMADDLSALLDHLAISRADVMGYSMGARIAAEFGRRNAARTRSLILGGIARGLIDGGLPGEAIAAALEAPTREDVTDPVGRVFRDFAVQTGSDLKALAACMRGSRERIPEVDIARLPMPVLIAVGTADRVAGRAQDLADVIPGAQVLDIPGRDHMRAVGDKVYKAGVLAFLSRRP